MRQHPSIVAVLLVVVSISAAHAADAMEVPATLGVPDPVCVETPPIDHVCIEDPVFPPDCVDQLGSIGGPPIAAGDEGYIGISAPVVDPLLFLRSSDGLDGLMYALNPADNTVRVWTPGSPDFVADIKVCYRPSALEQSPDGSEVYVACHASNAIGVIDTSQQLMVGLIQDRDTDGRPLLQEPMGMVARGDLLYVSSSQNNRIAVVDRTTRRVLRYILIPGQDPRALALAADAGYLIVANFLAGNRTEPERPDVANGNLAQACQDLLQDPTALAVFDESSPTFMDTSHPDYALIAECYLSEHITGRPDVVVINPDRTDHDVVVIRLADEQVVFTTDVLADDPGTLNYGVTFDPATNKVFLATVHARNELDSAFGKRPLLNRLVVLDFDPATGALSIDPSTDIVDLDAPFLDECDDGAARVATPYAVAVGATGIAIAATGSDTLTLADKDGNLVRSIDVGFGPKGVVLGPDRAWVYDATGLTVTEVDLTDDSVSETSLGENQVAQKVRIGARLFNSAEFAGNKTFACASCHPDGHLDGLVWSLNDTDKLRVTQTLQEISETAPYHWDGSKCNQVKILQDGITNLFFGDEPTLCEMETMIEFMDQLVRPHSPFRAPDDSMTDDALLGGAILHRASFKDAGDLLVRCTNRFEDMTVEAKYLDVIGDPQNQLFSFGGGGGPIVNTTDSESCSVSACHVAPHTESLGLNNMGQLRDGFQAVTTLGTWDRPLTMHDGRMAREKYILALETNRAFYGAPQLNPNDNYTGTLGTHGFNDAFFRHPEFNWDGNPQTNGFVLTDSLTEFINEEEELQSGTVGLTVVLSSNAAPANHPLLDELESAADQGKITLLGIGLINGALTSLTWQPGTGTYLTDGGATLTRLQLQQSLTAGDSMVLYGGLLPNQGSSPNPKLKAVLRDTSPYLCSEGFAEYQGAVLAGQSDVLLTLRGIDVVAGSRVLVDGQVTGAPLAGPGPDFDWTLPSVANQPTILTLQILGPTGMLSNSLPLPIVPAIVPATEPQIELALKGSGFFTFALVWDNQFGVTGPGTRYDVFRGLLSDLQASGTAGFANGSCLTDPPLATFFVIDDDEDELAPGDGFYYVIRAQNQVNQSTWGSVERDLQINAAAGACETLFP